MKLFDFLKEEWIPILIAMLVIGVSCCVIIFLVASDEPQAATLSAPLTENNEPTTEEVATTKKIATKVKATTKATTTEVSTTEETTTETTTTEISTTEEITEVEPAHYTYKYYDVPLDMDLQDHIFRLCDYYGVDAGLVIAIIQKESDFDPDVIGDSGNSFGLMQIQERWHIDRMARLECPALLNPYQNVEVGIDIIAELFGKFDDITWVLMAYNGGESYATDMRSSGQISEYARLVLKYKSELRYTYHGE